MHHATGPRQVLFVADAYPGRIYKLALDGTVLGYFGTNGKQLKQFNWIHAIACPSENEVLVGEILTWRVQKLLLHPKRAASQDQPPSGEPPLYCTFRAGNLVCPATGFETTRFRSVPRPSMTISAVWPSWKVTVG